MTNINPIETRYAGCRFRSRLEARYAVLFDASKIAWEYEPQGFTVGVPPRPYLPDFWLPGFGLWVEVKGHAGALDVDLMIDAVIPHWGLPANPHGDPIHDPSRCELRLLILGPIPRGGGSHSVLGFHKGDVYRTWFTFNGSGYSASDDEEIVANDGGGRYPLTRNLVDPLIWAEPRPFLAGPYIAARSARFEHGEAGA